MPVEGWIPPSPPMTQMIADPSRVVCSGYYSSCFIFVELSMLINARNVLCCVSMCTCVRVYVCTCVRVYVCTYIGWGGTQGMNNGWVVLGLNPFIVFGGWIELACLLAHLRHQSAGLPGRIAAGI